MAGLRYRGSPGANRKCDVQNCGRERPPTEIERFQRQTQEPRTQFTAVAPRDQRVRRRRGHWAQHRNAHRGRAVRRHPRDRPGDFFQVLGVNAALGRTLTPADEEPSASRPAVLSARRCSLQVRRRLRCSKRRHLDAERVGLCSGQFAADRRCRGSAIGLPPARPELIGRQIHHETDCSTTGVTRAHSGQ